MSRSSRRKTISRSELESFLCDIDDPVNDENINNHAGIGDSKSVINDSKKALSPTVPNIATVDKSHVVTQAIRKFVKVYCWIQTIFHFAVLYLLVWH